MPTPKDNDAATEIALTLIATASTLALAVLMYALETGLAARQSPSQKEFGQSRPLLRALQSRGRHPHEDAHRRNQGQRQAGGLAPRPA